MSAPADAEAPADAAQAGETAQAPADAAQAGETENAVIDASQARLSSLPQKTKSHNVARMPVFMFVNPTSGGNKAAAFTNIGKTKVDLDMSQEVGYQVRLYIYDIRAGKPGNKPGFQKLKKVLDSDDTEFDPENPSTTRVIVGGGDGTVMWTIIELGAHNVDMRKVALGVVPFGTGNDFSRTLGWGGYPPKELIGEEYKALRVHVRRWVQAQVQNHDIWEVNVTTHEQGNLLFIQDDKSKGLTDGQRKQHNITELPGGGMRMVKPLCNYFSFGWDPHAGLGFDKRRTKSQFLNILVYAHEGMKKQVPFRKPPRIDQTLDFMGFVKKDVALKDGTKLPVAKEDVRITAAIGKQEGAEGRFAGTPIDLIVLNIPSFAKGCNLWGCASGVGLLTPDGKQKPSDEKKALKGAQQKAGDGNLNVLTFRKIQGLNFDVVKGQAGVRSGPGMGSRIYQGSEDLVFTFKEPDKAKYTKDGRVYMQIDGEFFVARYPSQVTIRSKMKVRVLVCDEEKVGCCAAGGSTALTDCGAMSHQVALNRTRYFDDDDEA